MDQNMVNYNEDNIAMENWGHDADHPRYPEHQNHAEDPVEAAEREAVESLLALGNEPHVDAMRLQAAGDVEAEEQEVIELLGNLPDGILYKFFKTLTLNDATTESLRLSESEAALLFPGFGRQSFRVNGNSGRIHTIRFKMSDERGRNYNEMIFVGYLCKKVARNKPARITCDIKGQWCQFVTDNGLAIGDDVYIYRNLLAGNDLHFIFKLVRNGGN